MLEDEDRREEPRDRLVHRSDSRVDGLRRLTGFGGSGSSVSWPRPQAARHPPAAKRGQASARAPSPLKSVIGRPCLRGGLDRQALRLAQVPVEDRVPREEGDHRSEREKRAECDRLLARRAPVTDKQHDAGTAPAMKPKNRPTMTARPSPAPMKTASFTSPIPIPLRVREDDEEEREAGPQGAEHPYDARVVDRARNERRATALGRTIRSGISRCSRSVRVITTSTQQKNAAIAASSVRPNTSPDIAPSNAVPAVTSGSRREKGTRRRSGRADRSVGREPVRERPDGQTDKEPDEARAQVHRSRFPCCTRVPPTAARAGIPQPDDLSSAKPVAKRLSGIAVPSNQGCPSLELGAMRRTETSTVGETTAAPFNGLSTMRTR